MNGEKRFGHYWNNGEITCQVSVDICQRCHGSGLEPCHHNMNVSADNWKQYEICKKCKGEGVVK